jgi:hypothetical protein
MLAVCASGVQGHPPVRYRPSPAQVQAQLFALQQQQLLYNFILQQRALNYQYQLALQQAQYQAQLRLLYGIR